MTVQAQGLGVRRVELDRLRGLAIVLMVADHVALAAGLGLVRLSVGRLALPLFFVVAGHLAGRLRWRHAQIGCVGLLLPLLAPWVDDPNVLVWWALGCVLLWAMRRVQLPAWVVVVAALTMFANGYLRFDGGSYQPWALWALMGVGAVLPGSAFGWGARLPGWLGSLGRHPLIWYVGHVLGLSIVAAAFGLTLA